MKTFMSAALQNTETQGGLPTNKPMSTAPDNKQPQSDAPSKEPASSKPAEQQAAPANDKEKAVVVMQGPLGTAITEALNKSLAKSVVQGAPVQLPGKEQPAIESFALNYVQANGQIHNPSQFIAKVNKSVGLVPATDEAPTVINTMLDCASKVDDVEFIMVEKVENDPSNSQVPQKSMIYPMGEDVALEGLSVESVQVVVTYRKVPKK